MTSPEFPLHIDSTMISCFRSCPQKFFNEFCLGLRPTRVSVDLHAGACFATGIETIRKAFYIEHLSVNDALKKGFAAYLTAWGDFEPMTDTPKTRERVWEALETYFLSWYPPATDHIQPQAERGKDGFEFTFGIPLEPNPGKTYSEGFPEHPSGHPFIYSGRFDMLGTWSGRLIIVDEKTTKSIGSTWSEQWDLRSQFMGYCWACQQSGLQVDHVAVRGIGILKTKLTPAEAIKQYSASSIARWHEQLRRDLWRIRQAWDQQYCDFNLADSCTSYGGCSFRDLCASPDPSRWYSNFVVRRWNPLHKNPIDETAS